MLSHLKKVPSRPSEALCYGVCSCVCFSFIPPPIHRLPFTHREYLETYRLTAPSLNAQKSREKTEQKTKPQLIKMGCGPSVVHGKDGRITAGKGESQVSVSRDFTVDVMWSWTQPENCKKYVAFLRTNNI